MSGDSELDLKALRGMLGVAEPEATTPTPFTESVTAALTQAVDHLKASGMIEVEDAKIEALRTELIEATLESTSMKKLTLRLVKTLVHSDHLEEVYGTDEEISTALQPFLDQI